MIFDGIVLLSDIDGTLATYDRKILPENKEAIRYFTANGGRFGVATGRTARSAQRMISQIDVNCPCLVINGGGIYDPQTDKMLYSCYLDHAAACVFDKIIETVPGVGIEINNDGLLQCVKYSPRSFEHVMYELGEFTQYTMEDIPADSHWFKALFTGTPDEIDRVEAFCKTIIDSDAPYYVVRSEPTLFELLPKEAQKGKALIRLAEMLQIPIKNMYAIGDYYNDLDLLSAAGFSAAVKGAPKEVLAATDYVTCSCEEGAVADFIKFIEQKLKKEN
ncbi:MAG: HAD family hydrolase [Clostridia bacterium]|nr:HAD family hydrolase [Clostridia bacterium]